MLSHPLRSSLRNEYSSLETLLEPHLQIRPRRHRVLPSTDDASSDQHKEGLSNTLRCSCQHPDTAAAALAAARPPLRYTAAVFQSECPCHWRPGPPDQGCD